MREVQYRNTGRDSERQKKTDTEKRTDTEEKRHYESIFLYYESIFLNLQLNSTSEM